MNGTEDPSRDHAGHIWRDVKPEERLNEVQSICIRDGYFRRMNQGDVSHVYRYPDDGLWDYVAWRCRADKPIDEDA